MTWRRSSGVSGWILRCQSALPCIALVAVLSGGSTAAQVAYDLEDGQRVRVWIHDRLEPSEGLVSAVDHDSITVRHTDLDVRSIAWADVLRIERYAQNRRAEMVGVGTGIVGGGLLGGIIGAGVRPNDLGSAAAGTIFGSFIGAAVGASVGARTNRQWEEVPKTSLSYNGALRLRIAL